MNQFPPNTMWGDPHYYEDELPHEFGITKVRGYREWIVQHDAVGPNPYTVEEWVPYLGSSNLGQRWPYRVANEARCPNQCSPIVNVNKCGAIGYGCGLYAWHWLDGVVQNRYPFIENGYVWGVVEAWGRIVSHEKGFRAQYMQPVALVGDHHDIDRLGALYDVPVLEDFHAVMKSFPPHKPRRI